MIAELITTGSELMLGRVLNTHQQWISRQLADAGFVVSRQVSVPDALEPIQVAVRESLERADLIITTGGLGPTSDDVTRNGIAELLQLPLVEDAAVLEQVRQYFLGRGRAMPPATRVEALVPAGAAVLPNRYGTAPGLAITVTAGKFRQGAERQWLILLPGPPRELRPMFLESVLPLVRREYALESGFRCVTLRTCGVGESIVQERIESRLRERCPTAGIGYCARPGEVDIRLTVSGSHAEDVLFTAEALIRSELGEHVFGINDESLEEIVVRRLTERGRTVAVAESCTGGLIADRLTDVPGASQVFQGGFVTYSNALKRRCLGVSESTLSEHGAVSEAVAIEMACGARKFADSDYALAVTGIAGPAGGSVDKPVGTVYIALATPSGVKAWRRSNPWDRRTFKQVTAHQALNFLRCVLIS